MKAIIAAVILVALSGCAVNTITVNQYGPVLVSTGSSNAEASE